MKLKQITILFIIIFISNFIYGALLFDEVTNEKSINLTKQEHYRLASYQNNKTYEEIILVKSSINKDLLVVPELSFIDNNNTEYIFERVVNKKELKYSLWYGKSGENDITLVIDSGRITGTVALKTGVYQIAHLSGDVHILALLNNNSFCEEKTTDFSNEKSIIESKYIEATQKSGSTAQITILFAYTDDVVAVHGTSGIQSMIQTAESETNQSFSNSGADVEIEVVHMVEVNYNESGNAATDLNWFVNNSTIQQLRNQYGADVCMLVVDNSNSYGRTTGINASSSYAYALVRDDVVSGRYTPGHELGHIIGARHNVEHDPTLGPYSANHGFIEPVWPQKASWMTMMGVNELKYNPYGVRQKQWSRPTYYGNTTNANVVDVLNNYAGRVANFKDVPLVVNVTGPTWLIGTQAKAPQYHATGTWDADAEGGTGSYEYQWQYYGYYGWTDYTGETSFSMTKTLYYDPDGHDLQCVVTSGTQTESDQIHVYVTGDEPYKSSSMPETVVLESNSPNPFNPNTIIKFGLLKQQRVEINVYSITGKKIKTLVNNTMSAGYHKVNWNSTDEKGAKVSSGAYIYQLKCGNEVFAKKMIFAK